MTLTDTNIEEAAKLLKKGIGTKRISQLLNTTEWQIRKIKQALDGDEEALAKSKNPKQLFEEIKFESQTPSIEVIKKKGQFSVMIASDIHFPFEDKKAVNIFMQVASEYQPEFLVLMGDIIDVYELSSYSKNPLRSHNLKYEIDSTKEFFKTLRAALPKTRILFMAGNHEARFSKYIASRAPELASLEILNTKSILELDKFDIEYIKGDLKIGDMVFIHGSYVASHAGGTARKNLDNMGISNICGHIHRVGVVHKTTWEKEYVAIENGTLASRSQEYLGGNIPNWQQSFTVLNYMDDEFWYEIVHIKSGKAFFRGKFYKA